MSSINIAGDTSGSVILTVPAAAGSNTVTIAAQTGTLNAAGPAFSAYLSADTTITNNSYTKVTFDTKEFDTATNYSTSTGRFTPTVAGYYQVNASLNYGQGGGWGSVNIYKNGSAFKNMTIVNAASGTGNLYFGMTSLIYMNGSSDYLEVYGWQTSGGTITLYGRQASTYFQACLLRGA